MDETYTELNKDKNDRYHIPLGLEVVGLTAAGLCSCVIPEAAYFAMKLKWIILLESLLPLLAPFFRMPVKKYDMNRFGVIWACNSLVLTFALLFDKEYKNAGIYNSEDLATAISKLDSKFCKNIVGDFAVTYGIIGFFFIFSTLITLFVYVFPDNPVSRPVSSISPPVFMTLGASLSGNLIITSIPTSFINVVFSLLVLVPTSLLSVALTFTDSYSYIMKRWAARIFIALCITTSAFCIWGTARISSNLLVYGVICIAGYILTACIVTYRFSKQIPLTPSEIKENEIRRRERDEATERHRRKMREADERVEVRGSTD